MDCYGYRWAGPMHPIDGKMTGVWRCLNRETRWEKNYVGGLQHGSERWWHPNGQLRWEQPFEFGHEHGTRRCWYATGQLAGEKPDHEGLQRWWYPCGALWGDLNWAGGQREGTSHTFHANGRLEVEENWRGGKRSGDAALAWHDDGARKYVFPHDDDGEQHGTLREWDKEGTLVYEREWVHGAEQ